MIKARSPGFSATTISKWETPPLSERQHGSPEPPPPDPEVLRRQAVEQGYSEGLEKGRQQGLLETARKVQALEALLAAMAQPYEDLNEQALAALATLAGRIACCLVKRELHTDPDMIMAIVRDTVSMLNTSAGMIQVHLNPADTVILRELAHGDSDISRWALIDDPLIARGDCRVTSRDALIDGALLTRIDTILMQMQMQGDERD